MPSGGPRPGSGRKPGADWNGSGKYRRKRRLNVGLPPELYEWVEAEAERRGMTKSAVVAEAIAAQ
jgi:hypothetical protein